MTEERYSLILPIATIWETGNHISSWRMGDGNNRRAYAIFFVQEVTKSINGERPWLTTNFPDNKLFLEWLQDFPDSAMRSSSRKGDERGEGISLCDHSIIKECEQRRKQFSMSTVHIWALDKDFGEYLF